ncbi:MULTISPECIES: hypothetical protein [unclassified Blastococcus]
MTGSSFTALLAADDRPVCGVEHEYAVLAGGRPVDFRVLVDGLGLGRRLDPGDPHAHRGAWGGVVTADGAEAEVVTPPVAVGPGAVDELYAWTEAGRGFLSAHLPDGHALAGFSTHVSVSVPDRDVRRAATLLVAHLSPALMLLLEGPASPGMLVRPRPGRLEVCGEYATGRPLRLAVAVTLAAAELCAAAARSRRVRAGLPPRLAVRTEPSRQRFGTYVDRTAFGPDLYAESRAAVLRDRAEGPVRAGDHLRAAVDLLAGRLADLLHPADLAALDAVVTGRSPLPAERSAPADPDPPRRAVRPLDLATRERPRLRVELETATWWQYVFRAEGAAGPRWVRIPRPWLPSFLEAVDRGVLDEALTR